MSKKKRQELVHGHFQVLVTKEHHACSALGELTLANLIAIHEALGVEGVRTEGRIIRCRRDQYKLLCLEMGERPERCKIKQMLGFSIEFIEDGEDV